MKEKDNFNKNLSEIKKNAGLMHTGSMVGIFSYGKIIKKFLTNEKKAKASLDNSTSSTSDRS